MDDIDRYTTTHIWGNAKFTLEAYTPKQDECRLLMIKIVEQAVRDFTNLEDSLVPIEQQYYCTASGLIFNDSYRVDYGGQDMSFEDMLNILFDDSDGEVKWARKKILRLRDIKKAKKKKKG